MSKYDRLGEYLNEQGESPTTMTFKKIEGVLGFSLPKSAHRHRPWWGNNEGHVQANAWLSRGWHVASVDQGGRWVTFRRAALEALRQPEQAPAKTSWHNDKEDKHSKLGDHPDRQSTSPATMTFSQNENVDLGARQGTFQCDNGAVLEKSKQAPLLAWIKAIMEATATLLGWRKPEQADQAPATTSLPNSKNGKYSNLGDYLAKQPTSSVTMTFKQVEEVLMASLPPSAYRYREWWADDRSHVQAKAWLSRGWCVENVDLHRRQVTFQRDNSTSLEKPRPHARVPEATFRSNNKTSKYSKLGEHLAKQPTSPVTMTFKQVEEVLAFRLPKSAYQYHVWWAHGGGHSHANAWFVRGWRTEKVDMRKQQVVFRRDNNTTLEKPRQHKQAPAATSWLNNKTGKYSKLGDHLDRQTASPITMTFSQIEDVLGFPLPQSAYDHRPWWANGASQANTWISRGWRTERVDMRKQQVAFRRGK